MAGVVYVCSMPGMLIMPGMACMFRVLRVLGVRFMACMPHVLFMNRMIHVVRMSGMVRMLCVLLAGHRMLRVLHVMHGMFMRLVPVAVICCLRRLLLFIHGRSMVVMFGVHLCHSFCLQYALFHFSDRPTGRIITYASPAGLTPAAPPAVWRTG